MASVSYRAKVEERYQANALIEQARLKRIADANREFGMGVFKNIERIIQSANS
jgi:hypothetical protein